MNSLANISEIDNSIIHVIPSFACNLDCPHCDVKHKTEQYKFNEEKFFEKFDQIQRRHNSVALFGGEPLLNNKKLLFRILDSGKITTTTSNLLVMDDEILDKLIEKKVIIGTSWNPARMTSEQYDKWLGKIKQINDRGVWVAVFITLTDDLPESRILDVLDDLNELMVATVTFSLVVPCTPELVTKIDNWLCWLEEHWRWKFRNKLREEYLCLNGKKNSCKYTSFTLYPNGTMTDQCTHSDNPNHWDGYEGCPTCEYRHICRPCPKQPCCHFFKNYYLLLARYTMLNTYAVSERSNRKLIPNLLRKKRAAKVCDCKPKS